MTLQPMLAFERTAWPSRGKAATRRIVAEETPVALVHDGSTTAVMMASPADLEDLLVGFSLTEGIVGEAASITAIDVVHGPRGAEARAWLTPGLASRLAQRRRRLAGPTGCGLCGVESLEAALPRVRPVAAEARVTAGELLAAMAAMGEEQALGRATRAAHAAGFARRGRLVAVREDVGRHNALDKLVGALTRAGEAPDGVVALTSRVSVEMVQKAAMFGAPVICAVSAPTALAIRTAEAANITLVAVCRSDGFEVFTHPRRIDLR